MVYQNIVFRDCQLKFHLIAYYMLILLFLAVEHKGNMQVLEQSELIMNTMAMATERYIHPVSVLIFFSFCLPIFVVSVAVLWLCWNMGLRRGPVTALYP